MQSTVHTKFFEDTFVYYTNIPEGIKEGLWNYLAYGFQPGGFVTSVLKNDFFGAMCRADHTWNGQSFKELAKWVDAYIPKHIRGDDQAIFDWMTKHTDEERRNFMIEWKLRPDEFDILSGRVTA